MTISRAEVITSVERRRRWSQDEKERLVAASLEPGATVSEVARMAGFHVSQLFRWRKELCKFRAVAQRQKRLLFPFRLINAPQDIDPRVVTVPRKKVGRNDPCPCGSGKKYKKCCGLN